MAIGDSLANPNLWVDDTYYFNDAISGGTPRFISIPLRAGQSYYFLVTGSSGTFDAFLTLYDTLDNAQAVLATDDNSLDAISEPLINGFTAPVTGIYYLGCSTLDFDGTFSFAGAATSGGFLTYFRSKVANRVENFFQVRYAKISNKIAFFLQRRMKQISNAFNAYDVHFAMVNNRFSIASVTKASIGSGGDKHHIWSKDGYEIFANNILIGYLPEGVFTLTDIVLADGDYDIEVRPLGNFYREVGVRQSFKVNLNTVNGVTELLPDINNLVTQVANTWTWLAWSIKPQITATTARIGIWFSGSSGIVISGNPDVSFPIGFNLDYRHRFKQTVSQWAAVATYSGSDRGISNEIELIWDSVAPDAPEHQHIIDIE